jgi:hypothetical protein
MERIKYPLGSKTGTVVVETAAARADGSVVRVPERLYLVLTSMELLVDTQKIDP